MEITFKYSLLVVVVVVDLTVETVAVEVNFAIQVHPHRGYLRPAQNLRFKWARGE
jgi:hypothetical protein